jgi:protein gp37
MSKIEWTGETWNPLVGCTIHSAGCKGCYAMKDAYRLMHNPHSAIAAKFAGTAKMVNGHAVWTGRINFDEASLLKPLRRRTPTTYFVNSMSDLFHQAVTDEQIDRIFAVMALCPQHTFQVLTKRADRMQAYFSWKNTTRSHAVWRAMYGEAKTVAAGAVLDSWYGGPNPEQWPLQNVWLGVSVEDQRAADERIPDLLATPAAVRFLSCEPLIGPVNIIDGMWAGDGPPAADLEAKIDWVICGGESGPRARPMHPTWARSLRDHCAAAGVPFFFKQWGEWAPGENATGAATRTERTAEWFESGWHFSSLTPRISEELHRDDAPDLYRLGKRDAGRWLDGIEHNGMPA